MTTGRLLRSLAGLVLLVGLLVATFSLGPAMDRSVPNASTGAPVPTGPTIVVGAGSLSWQDVDPRTTPHLWSLLAGGGSAALVVRSVHATTCPLDAWLGLSAGVRASAGPGGSGATPACVPVPRPRWEAATGSARQPESGGAGSAGLVPARVPGWDRWRRLAGQRLMDARPGLLADTLRAHGRCVSAIGRGAAVAAADHRGRVAHWTPWTSSGPLPLDACPVTLVDVAGEPDGGPASLAQVDRRVGRVLAQAPADAEVVVAGLDDAGPSARLHLLAVRPPADRAGAPGSASAGTSQTTVAGDRRTGSPQPPATVAEDRLVGSSQPSALPRKREVPPVQGRGTEDAGLVWSTSTRQLGLVQSADLTATVLARAGVPLPTGAAGAPLRLPANPTAQAGERLQTLRGLGKAAVRVSPLVAPFFVGVVALQLVGYGLAWWRWRRAGSVSQRAADADHAERTGAAQRTRRRVAAAVAAAATAAAGIPAATYLAQAFPWWRAASPAAALVGAVAGFTLALVAIGYAGFGWHRHGPVAAVCAGTVLVLAVDAATGSRLVLSSLLGVQPLVGGRYYGIGNVAFAVLATAVLLAATLAAGPWVRRGRHRAGVAVILLVGLGAVVVDGSPWWGSDLGGVAALLPAVLVLAAGASGLRWTWGRGVAAASLTLMTLVAALVVDWLRPPAARTHLGRFVEALLDGSAGDIVLRKLEQNLTVLLHAPLAVLVPVGLAAVLWPLARPRTRVGRPLATLTTRVPLLRAALWAVAVCLVLGFLVNDTGVAIPPVGALVLLPALVALAARTAPGTGGPAVGPTTADGVGAERGGPAAGPVRADGRAADGSPAPATRRGTARRDARAPASPRP